jgi:Peptidase family M23
MAVALARIRVPLVYLGLAAMVVDSLLWDLPRWPLLAFLTVAFAVYLRLGTVRRPPVQVAMPVTGRWLAHNSPADRVPSHHLHAYGQTYAIDLVHVPEGRHRPGLGWWPPARRPQDFPGFGQPVLAPAGGVVVRAHDGERDHATRTSPPAILYLLLEGALRELLGPGRILGSHVVLDLGGGVYALFAHLRRGSLRVRRGDRVEPGRQLAECGNSGNSSEPHLHFQLTRLAHDQDHGIPEGDQAGRPGHAQASSMDHPSVLLAAGLPLRFDRYDGERAGVPHAGQPFSAPPPEPVSSAPRGETLLRR